MGGDGDSLGVPGRQHYDSVLGNTVILLISVMFTYNRPTDFQLCGYSALYTVTRDKYNLLFSLKSRLILLTLNNIEELLL